MTAATNEMFSRLTSQLVSNWGWIAFFFLLALLFILLETTFRLKSVHRLWIYAIVLTVASTGALIWGIKLSWISDDAFISFRYADNLVNGYGLVFNPGERVEGYTNFLWTMLMAGLIALGFDPAQGSIVVSLCCFVLLIAVVWRIVRLLTSQQNRCVAAVSIAAIFAAANTLLASFATSGLETMAAATLTMVALERALNNAPTRSGLAGIGATMMHPDHGIFYATLGLSMAFTEKHRAGLFRYIAPFLFVYCPYFLWRWAYYGDFFPNTYYAKSAGLNYFGQGWIYIRTFFIGSGLWAITPLFCYTIYRCFRSLFGKYLLFSTPPFLFYIAKIGGDFMYGRLLISLIAPLLIASEIATRDLWRKKRYRLAIAALLLFSVTAVPIEWIKPQELDHGISDESTFYRLTSFSPIRIASNGFQWAQDIKHDIADRGLTPTLAFHRVGMIGYYTRLNVVDLFGITNRDIGHRPIKRRGRPGHEKHATRAYIVNSDADISDTTVYPNPYPNWSKIILGETSLHLIHYEPRTIRALKGKKGVIVDDIEQTIDKYIRLLPKKTDREQLACDAWFFQEFYLSRVNRSKWRNALERRLLELSLPSDVALDPGLIPRDFRRTHRRDDKGAFHFNPEDRARFELNGRDFEGVQVFRLPVWPGEVARNQGAFLSTFHPKKGDKPIVYLISKPFELVGDVMELKLAGGRNSRRERVALIIDGSTVFTATGCDRNMMGSRLWLIKPYKGKEARLQIIDSDRSKLGHIIVDEVVQWVDSR